MRYALPWILLPLLLVAACGEQETPVRPSRPFSTVVEEGASGAAQDVANTVKSPLDDLGILEASIPPRLQQLSVNPYQTPAEPLCTTIAAELAELEGLLGPDIDNPAANSISSYTEQGMGMARSQASSMLRSRIDVIPFQGIVRRFSGADKHARAVARAYEAGKLRRAFLKGLGKAYRCAAVCR